MPFRTNTASCVGSLAILPMKVRRSSVSDFARRGMCGRSQSASSRPHSKESSHFEFNMSAVHVSFGIAFAGSLQVSARARHPAVRCGSVFFLRLASPNPCRGA